MSWLLGVLREITDLQVSIADIADILTVAILIYALLVLLRGTRAMQMLWGIVIILGLYLAASSLKLITLSTILSNLLVFLPIAIIVLFQQEIRRMLTAFDAFRGPPMLQWVAGRERARWCSMNSPSRSRRWRHAVSAL